MFFLSYIMVTKPHDQWFMVGFYLIGSVVIMTMDHWLMVSPKHATVHGSWRIDGARIDGAKPMIHNDGFMVNNEQRIQLH